MKKLRILCSLLVICFLPICSAGAETLYVNQSFNDCVTNGVPSGIDTSNAKPARVVEYAPKEKGLLLDAKRSASTIKFEVPSLNKMCVSFDISTVDKGVEGSLYIENAIGTRFTVFSFDRANEILTYNGKHIAGYNSSLVTTVAFYIDTARGYMDIYVDGKLTVSRLRIFNLNVKEISAFYFSFSSSDEGQGVILDNINAHDSSEPKKTYPSAAYNAEEIEYDPSAFEAVLGNKVIMNTGFEDDTTSFALQGKGNIMEKRKMEDGNTVIYFERTNASDFHADGRGVSSDTDFVVYEFDICMVEQRSNVQVNLKDNAAQYSIIASISGTSISAGGRSYGIKTGEWYKVSAIYNYYDRVRSFYVNGNLLVSDISFEDQFAKVSGLETFRFHVPATSSPSSAPVQFMIDNCRIYESSELLEEVGAFEKKIVLSDKSVFESEKKYETAMQGYSSVHKRSGVVYNSGQKSLMQTKPYEIDGTTMVSLKELSGALDLSYSRSGAQAKAGDITVTAGSATINVNGLDAAMQAAAVAVGDDIHIPLDAFLQQGLGKQLYEDSTAINSGMTVFGSKAFAPPESEGDLQKLNDFLFYLRPTIETVEQTYDASDLKGVHPRIHATAEDFAKIRNEVNENAIKKDWAQNVIQEAERLLGTDAIFYELRDGVRLLYVCRDVLTNMYTLGMAYQLTGEQKYVDRAYIDLEAVSEFPDWNPGHHIDVGEMAAAVAIGYDWMYHAFTPEQRTVIEEGMLNNCFYDAVLSYESTGSLMANGSVADNNHNVVCNGGMSMGALAMLDVYPEVATHIIKNAVRALELMMYHFAPMGAWFEGPHYWEYTMQYTAKMLQCLEKALGTSFGLAHCEGLSTSADYMLFMQSPNGIFNYGDGGEYSVYVPEMFWLSNKYGNKEITSAVLYLTKNRMTNLEDMVLGLLWYDTSISASQVNLPTDSYYTGEEVVSMRDSWMVSEPTFAAVHAGQSNVAHAQLDAGTFVFDAMGIRWAKDLGMGNYNLPGFWEMEENGRRWLVYRNRAESHNTVVVNPGSGPDHNVKSFAPIIRYESKPKGTITVVDMSDVLKGETTSAKRGFYFADTRQTLVIRDEMQLPKASTVYWFMTTIADVEIQGNTAILSQGGRKLRLEFASNHAAEITCAVATPLPGSPVVEGDTVESAKRIAIKITGSASTSITVKLTPYDLEGAPLSDFDRNIDSWVLPDGEIPPAPALSAVTVGGKEYEAQKYIYYPYVDGEITEVPQVSAYHESYTVEIEQAASLSETTKIRVSDSNDPDNKTLYFVVFYKIAKPKEFDGKRSLPIISVKVSDEPQSDNLGINMLDGNLSTRWSADGIGQYAIFELRETAVLNTLAIGFYLGDQRQTKIDISVSADGVHYEEVFRGMSSGATDQYEFFDLQGKQARYIRIGCDGNTTQSVGGWNSITEVVAMQNAAS